MRITLIVTLSLYSFIYAHDTQQHTQQPHTIPNSTELEQQYAEAELVGQDSVNDDFFEELDALIDEKEHEEKMTQIKNERPPSWALVLVRQVGLALALKYIAMRSALEHGYSSLSTQLKKLFQTKQAHEKNKQ